MLLFELFPFVVAIAGLLAGVGLYRAERRARAAGIEDGRPKGTWPRGTGGQRDEPRGSGRPSMRS